jgi:hypothetical protein
MKNVFATIALASFVSLPALFAAEVIGLVPSLPFSAEVLIGAYVGGGVFAFAWCDYSRGLRRCEPRLRKAVRPQPAAKPARHEPVVGWEHQTISA